MFKRTIIAKEYEKMRSRETIDIKPEELEMRLLPLKGLEFVARGLLEFRMTRDEVWEFFEKHFNVVVAEARHKLFNQNREKSIDPLCMAIDIGFRKLTDRVECFEVNNSFGKLEILGKYVFSISMLEALRWCREVDPESYDEDEGITSSRYGFRLGTQQIDWRRMPAETAVLFGENYA